MFIKATSLVPRPHLQGGKGSGELGPALRNFHAPIKSQLWHCHMTTLPQECNIAITCSINELSHMQSCRPRPQLCLPPIACAAIQTNQIQALHGLVGAHHRTRIEDSAEVHQTFFSQEVGYGSGNETTK